MLDRLRKELRDAFLPWISIRRNTEGKLAELAKILPSLLRKPNIAKVAAVGFVLGAVAAPFTFGASLIGVGAAAGLGIIGAAIGALAPYFSAEVEKNLGLAELQAAIDMDRKACTELQLQLESMKGTLTSSSTSSGAAAGTMVRNLSDALTRASRFVDSSLLPEDITQLLKSSLDRHHGSTSAIVQEIRGIVSNLKCPDETDIQLLVENFIADAKCAEM